MERDKDLSEMLKGKENIELNLLEAKPRLVKNTPTAWAGQSPRTTGRRSVL